MGLAETGSVRWRPAEAVSKHPSSAIFWSILSQSFHSILWADGFFVNSRSREVLAVISKSGRLEAAAFRRIAHTQIVKCRWILQSGVTVIVIQIFMSAIFAGVFDVPCAVEHDISMSLMAPQLACTEGNGVGKSNKPSVNKKIQVSRDGCLKSVGCVRLCGCVYVDGTSGGSGTTGFIRIFLSVRIYVSDWSDRDFTHVTLTIWTEISCVVLNGQEKKVLYAQIYF